MIGFPVIEAFLLSYCTCLRDRSAGDIKKATSIATQMVMRYGMSPKVGPIAYMGAQDNTVYMESDEEEFDFRDVPGPTADLLMSEINRFLEEARERAEEVLTKNKKILERLVELLLDRYDLLGAEVYAICEQVSTTVSEPRQYTRRK